MRWERRVDGFSSNRKHNVNIRQLLLLPKAREGESQLQFLTGCALISSCQGCPVTDPRRHCVFLYCKKTRVVCHSSTGAPALQQQSCRFRRIDKMEAIFGHKDFAAYEPHFFRMRAGLEMGWDLEFDRLKGLEKLTILSSSSCCSFCHN